MQLREEAHRYLDALDDNALVLAHAYIQQLIVPDPGSDDAPTLEEVLRLTSVSKGTWSDDVVAARDDRSAKGEERRYSLDELDALLESDTGDWGRIISEDREDRV